jgi:hypothetical protein
MDTDLEKKYNMLLIYSAQMSRLVRSLLEASSNENISAEIGSAIMIEIDLHTQPDQVPDIIKEDFFDVDELLSLTHQLTALNPDLPYYEARRASLTKQRDLLIIKMGGVPPIEA